MKNITLLLFAFFLFSCGKDKVIQLPEINHSEISEITDVSAAYIFYDESQPDSTELNRRNLISTTNWLINVDKRLALKQVIPHIKFLQEKKGNSSHKNEKAKNYFTCNDASRKNLGFIEFTDVVFQKQHIINLIDDELNKKKQSVIIFFSNPNDIKIYSASNDYKAITQSTISQLQRDVTSIIEKQHTKTSFILNFDENLSFQNYISFKSTLSFLKEQPIFISQNEFISN